MPSHQLWVMVNHFRGFQVKNTKKWFAIPFFWGHSGTVWLIGCTSCIYIGRRHNEEPTSDLTARYLNHWALVNLEVEVKGSNLLFMARGGEVKEDCAKPRHMQPGWGFYEPSFFWTSTLRIPGHYNPMAIRVMVQYTWRDKYSLPLHKTIIWYYLQMDKILRRRTTLWGSGLYSSFFYCFCVYFAALLTGWT